MILFNAPQLVQIDEAFVDSVLAERHFVSELHVFPPIVAQLRVARLLGELARLTDDELAELVYKALLAR